MPTLRSMKETTPADDAVSVGNKAETEVVKRLDELEKGSYVKKTLKDRQNLVIHRFNQFCAQKAILLVHSVGSGKTLTSLSMALNSINWGAKTIPNIVIVCPSGIYNNFIDDIKDINGVSVDTHQSRESLSTSVYDKTRLLYDVTTEKGIEQVGFFVIGYKYKFFTEPIATGDYSGLTAAFKDAIVIFDEAHRLFRQIPQVKNKRLLDIFLKFNLISSCYKFICMTGTPYSSGMEDIFSIIRFIECANQNQAAEELTKDLVTVYNNGAQRGGGPLADKFSGLLSGATKAISSSLGFNSKLAVSGEEPDRPDRKSALEFYNTYMKERFSEILDPAIFTRVEQAMMSGFDNFRPPDIPTAEITEYIGNFTQEMRENAESAGDLALSKLVEVVGNVSSPLVSIIKRGEREVPTYDELAGNIASIVEQIEVGKTKIMVSLTEQVNKSSINDGFSSMIDNLSVLEGQLKMYTGFFNDTVKMSVASILSLNSKLSKLIEMSYNVTAENAASVATLLESIKTNVDHNREILAAYIQKSDILDSFMEKLNSVSDTLRNIDEANLQEKRAELRAFGIWCLETFTITDISEKIRDSTKDLLDKSLSELRSASEFFNDRIPGIYDNLAKGFFEGKQLEELNKKVQSNLGTIKTLITKSIGSCSNINYDTVLGQLKVIKLADIKDKLVGFAKLPSLDENLKGVLTVYSTSFTSLGLTTIMDNPATYYIEKTKTYLEGFKNASSAYFNTQLEGVKGGVFTYLSVIASVVKIKSDSSHSQEVISRLQSTNEMVGDLSGNKSATFLAKLLSKLTSVDSKSTEIGVDKFKTLGYYLFFDGLFEENTKALVKSGVCEADSKFWPVNYGNLIPGFNAEGTLMVQDNILPYLMWGLNIIPDSLSTGPIEYFNKIKQSLQSRADGTMGDLTKIKTGTFLDGILGFAPDFVVDKLGKLDREFNIFSTLSEFKLLKGTALEDKLSAVVGKIQGELRITNPEDESVKKLKGVVTNPYRSMVTKMVADLISKIEATPLKENLTPTINELKKIRTHLASSEPFSFSEKITQLILALGELKNSGSLSENLTALISSRLENVNEIMNSLSSGGPIDPQVVSRIAGRLGIQAGGSSTIKPNESKATVQEIFAKSLSPKEQQLYLERIKRLYESGDYLQYLKNNSSSVESYLQTFANPDSLTVFLEHFKEDVIPTIGEDLNRHISGYTKNLPPTEDRNQIQTAELVTKVKNGQTGGGIFDLDFYGATSSYLNRESGLGTLARNFVLKQFNLHIPFNYEKLANDCSKYISVIDVEMQDSFEEFAGKRYPGKDGIVPENKLLPGLVDLGFEAIADVENGIKVTQRTAHRYPEKEVFIFYVHYTVEQNMYFKNIKTPGISGKHWIDGIGKLDDIRNPTLRGVGNYSKDFDTYTAMFNFSKVYPKYKVTRPDSKDRLSAVDLPRTTLPDRPHTAEAPPARALNVQSTTTRPVAPSKNIIDELLTKAVVITNDVIAGVGAAETPINTLFDCPKFRRVLQHLLVMKAGKMYTLNGLQDQPHLTTIDPDLNYTFKNHDTDVVLNRQTDSVYRKYWIQKYSEKKDGKGEMIEKLNKEDAANPKIIRLIYLSDEREAGSVEYGKWVPGKYADGKWTEEKDTNVLKYYIKTGGEPDEKICHELPDGTNAPNIPLKFDIYAERVPGRSGSKESGPKYPRHIDPVHSYDEATHYFLPLVWSCAGLDNTGGAEAGINLFAAFLTQIGLNYVVLHSEAGKADLEYEKVRATKKVYNLLQGAKREKFISDLLSFSLKDAESPDFLKILLSLIKENKEIMEDPLCVLIHPEMTEGIDCKFNPAIMLLEPPNTFGDYEQLCGRVLRTYDRGYNVLPKKMVYQFACYNTENLNQIWEKRSSFFKSSENNKRSGMGLFYDMGEDGKPKADLEQAMAINNEYLSQYAPKSVFMQVAQLTGISKITDLSNMSGRPPLEVFFNILEFQFKSSMVGKAVTGTSDKEAGIMREVLKKWNSTSESNPDFIDVLTGRVNYKLAMAVERQRIIVGEVANFSKKYNDFSKAVTRPGGYTQRTESKILDSQMLDPVTLSNKRKNFEANVEELNESTFQSISPDLEKIQKLQQEEYQVKLFLNEFKKNPFPDLVEINKCVANQIEKKSGTRWASRLSIIPWCDPMIRPTKGNQMLTCIPIDTISDIIITNETELTAARTKFRQIIKDYYSSDDKNPQKTVELIEAKEEYNKKVKQYLRIKYDAPVERVFSPEDDSSERDSARKELDEMLDDEGDGVISDEDKLVRKRKEVESMKEFVVSKTVDIEKERAKKIEAEELLEAKTKLQTTIDSTVVELSGQVENLKTKLSERKAEIQSGIKVFFEKSKKLKVLRGEIVAVKLALVELDATMIKSQIPVKQFLVQTLLSTVASLGTTGVAGAAASLAAAGTSAGTAAGYTLASAFSSTVSGLLSSKETPFDKVKHLKAMYIDKLQNYYDDVNVNTRTGTSLENMTFKDVSEYVNRTEKELIATDAEIEDKKSQISTKGLEKKRVAEEIILTGEAIKSGEKIIKEKADNISFLTERLKLIASELSDMENKGAMEALIKDAKRYIEPIKATYQEKKEKVKALMGGEVVKKALDAKDTNYTNKTGDIKMAFQKLDAAIKSYEADPSRENKSQVDTLKQKVDNNIAALEAKITKAAKKTGKGGARARKITRRKYR